ncbi:MAG: DUF4389 domain-containing protein [Gammaproteobacteria bacterium]|nr:DUF4389 domain-containing protein [Gammaproteobacteria bacterium]
MIDKISKDELKSNLLSPKHWLRLIFMLVFVVLLYVASTIIGVLIALQFLFALITGKDNTNLRSLGGSITTYIFQVLQFLTYNSEDKAFPFSEWPAASAQSNVAARKASKESINQDEGKPE